MPAPRTQDNSGVARRIKVSHDFLFGLLKDLFFNVLTFPILIVQFASEFGRLNRIISQEQAQCFFRRCQPSSCVQPWSKPITDVIRHDGRFHSRDFDQFYDPGAP